MTASNGFARLFKSKSPKGSTSKLDIENPYLDARRTWNNHVGSVVSSRQTWQVIGILSLLIALAGVGGIIHIGSQSKFVPYIIEVDKLGQSVAVGPAQQGHTPDLRVIKAQVAAFINDARMVTPDVFLQRKAIFSTYALLAPNDPGTQKMTDWLNGTPESSPLARAAKEMVSVEVQSVLQQTPETWQVEWEEVTRDRQGVLTDRATWRAMVTVYVAETTASTSEEQIRLNPLGTYVRDFSWSKQI